MIFILLFVVWFFLGFPFFPIFPRDGLIHNFVDVNIGFGDQKILSDLGMVFCV